MFLGIGSCRAGPSPFILMRNTLFHQILPKYLLIEMKLGLIVNHFNTQLIGAAEIFLYDFLELGQPFIVGLMGEK